MTNKLNKLLLSILAAFFVGSGYAHDVEIDGIFYNLDTDSKTASVTYKGAFFLFDSDRYIGNVVIPKEITHDGNTYSVMSIGDRAFYLCSGLTSVDIPSSVTSIGGYAFYDCSSLTSVDIPSSVTSIEGLAFNGCSGLTAINVSSDNSEYSSADGILYNKDKTCLYVCPGGKVGDFTIPSSVTSIGDNAFSDCSGLTSVTIPSSVTSIGYGAFYYCANLTAINVSSDNSVFSSADGILYNKDKTHLYVCPGGKVGVFTIPSSVTSIEVGAFFDCSGLTSVTIPSSVASIGRLVFNGCSSLTSVTIPSSVTSIGESAFSDCSGLTSVTIPSSVTSIGNSAFSGCSGLTSVTIPSSVTSIGGGAFYGCSGLTSVTIPSSVTSIEFSVFYGCSGLTSVSIPSSVTSIGNNAFYNCSGLTSVTIPSSVKSIGAWAFGSCSSLKAIYSFSSVPPECVYTPFDYKNQTLYVPFEAVEAYKSTDPWSNFLNIQGFDPTGIDGISDQSLPVAAARYDAAGRKIAAPVKGLNVIRYSNGKTQKIVVK